MVLSKTGTVDRDRLYAADPSHVVTLIMKTLLFFLSSSIVFTYEICDTNLDPAQVFDWWSKAAHGSEECMCDDVVDEFDATGKPSLVSSFVCQSDLSSRVIRDFSFDGTMSNDGKLRGRGTLRIEGTPNHNENICLAVGTIRGKKPRKITGNFVDGKLSGRTTVEFQDGAFMKGEFREGILHGFARFFSAKGNLKQVGQYVNGDPVGKWWFSIRGHLVLRRIDDRIALVLSAKGDAFTGFYFDDRLLLLNARPVLLRSKSDCFLTLETSIDASRDGKESRYSLQESRQSDRLQCPRWLKEHNGSLGNWLQRWFSLKRDTLWDSLEWTDDARPDDNSTRLITNLVRKDDHGVYEAVLNGVHALLGVDVKHTDDDGRPHGPGSVHVISTTGEQTDLPWQIVNINGHFKNGELHGPVFLGTSDFRFVNTEMKDGVIDGMVLVLGVVPLHEDPDQLITVKGESTPGIGFLGRMRNGRPVGRGWIEMLGGGFLHGHVTDRMTITDKEAVYVYPDMETALMGKFIDNRMESAREVNVTGVGCDGDVLTVKTSRPSSDAPVFRFGPPDSSSFGPFPHLRDPYDAKNVAVRQSLIPGSGRGVFAKRFIPAGRAFALYSSPKMTSKEFHEYDTRCAAQHSVHKCREYWISIDGSRRTMVIPPEFPVPDSYSATSGHMVNCRIEDEANTLFLDFDHPRFGLIVSVVAKRYIEADEEVYVDYGYKGKDVTPWYVKLKEQYERRKSAGH